MLDSKGSVEAEASETKEGANDTIFESEEMA